LIAMGVGVAIRSVYPSGTALATAVAPMTVPAPGLFSIRTGLPSRPSSLWPTRRANISVLPPDTYGTMMVTGRVG
jgi:hypothetical protein